MGIYLNSKKPCALYESEASGAYFVDKSAMLEKLIPLAEQGNQYVCITRPRRFGKTVMANMIGAFWGKGADSRKMRYHLSGNEIKDDKNVSGWDM